MALFLLFCAVARAGDANVIHWRQAERARETAAFEPPAAPPASLAWSLVQLPDGSPRSAGQPERGDAAAAEQADVLWWRLRAPGAARAGQDVHLYLPRWQTVGTVAVYADGRLIDRTRGSRVWNSFNRPLWLPLPRGDDGRAPGEVLIRMASAPGVGGVISTAWAGPAEALAWRHRARLLVQVDLVVWGAVAFLAIGLFALAVWVARRRETMYLLFFAMSTLYAARYRHMSVDGQSPWLPDDWFGWMTVNALGWSVVANFLFLLLVCGRALPRLERFLIAAGVAAAVLTSPVAMPWLLAPALLPLANGAVWLLQVAVVAIGGWAARRGRGRMAWAIVWLYGLMAAAAVYDLGLQNYWFDPEGIYLLPHMGMGLLGISMAIIWRRYIDSLRAAENVSADLARRVAEREAELTESHRQLRELERRHALEQERQRMMREMHDGMGAALVSALRGVERGALQRGQIAQVLRECIDELKLSIDSLSIADPDLLLVLATLRDRLQARLEAAGIELRWNVSDVPPLPWLDAQAALHILRILQEVLTNIIKHTQTSRIAFATRHDERDVTVEVRDNGGGHFTHMAGEGGALTGGRGLPNIAHRAQAIGATCAWSAAQDGGVFTLRLPLRGRD